MSQQFLISCITSALLLSGAVESPAAGPFIDGTFRGRIAWSADGNHNDPDDWIASPVALAIFVEAGLKDRLVHFDYNCILPLTDAEFERKHTESVLGTAERYGYDRSRFIDCRKNLDQAVADIVRIVNDSSADNPLWFVIAGPVEVPLLGLKKADRAKLPFVYCISHSRWNDGFAARYSFRFTKRSVIEEGVKWVQIHDQNALLSKSPYGREAKGDEWGPYHWMRDARDERVRWLWERMLVSTRPDPSDAGMAWFLITGDEQCDPGKLKQLLDSHQVPQPSTRTQVRFEAENFRYLDRFEIEDGNDRKASHRLHVVLNGGEHSRLRTKVDQPYAPAKAQCSVDVRFSDGSNRSRFTLLINGTAQGAPWESPGKESGWMTHQQSNVLIQAGDEIALDVEGRPARVDYIQVNY